MKNKKTVAAPLYSVLGNLTKSSELNIRVIPLTRARQKGSVWIYPSEGGNKHIPVKSLDKIDSSDFANPEVNRKAYRGYCFKSGINSLTELIKKKHGKGVPVTVVKPAVVKSNPIPVVKAKKINVPVAAVLATLVVTKKEDILPIESIGVSGRKFSKADQDDINAVNAVLSGSKDKFAVLYKRYYNTINYKYSTSLKYNKELADDLTADLFVRVYNNLSSYKPNYTFNSWITRVAHNFLIDYTRKPQLDTVSMDAGKSSEKMRNDDSDFIAFEVRDGVSTPEEGMITEQKNQLVKESIDKLEENYKNVMQKLFLEEKSYIEISDEMELPLNSVKSIIFRAKARLKEIINANKIVLAAVTY